MRISDWSSDVCSSDLGAFYWDVYNRGRAPAYTLVGARIAVGDADDRWEFSLRADNIFNEKYFTELGFGGLEQVDANGMCSTASPCHQGYPGTTRSFTGTISFSFCGLRILFGGDRERDL